MQIFFPKEETNEIRATILPEVAKKFIDLGIEVSVETGLGDKVFVSDDLYAQAGAKICNDINEALSGADIVCKINRFLGNILISDFLISSSIVDFKSSR